MSCGFSLVSRVSVVLFPAVFFATRIIYLFFRGGHIIITVVNTPTV